MPGLFIYMKRAFVFLASAVVSLTCAFPVNAAGMKNLEERVIT